MNRLRGALPRRSAPGRGWPWAGLGRGTEIRFRCFVPSFGAPGELGGFAPKLLFTGGVADAILSALRITIFPMPTSLSERFDLVIFDWAGTMVDFGCRAPVVALQKAFGRYGVSLTEKQVRRDMGKAKADHVRALFADAGVAAAWKAANGAIPTTQDCAALTADLGLQMREQAELAATLIDGARETVEKLRAAGLRVASSTGYTRAMMEPVLRLAASQGYVPDHLVCSGETPQGRPSPLMIYKTCVDLGVWPLSRVIKVDDSEAGVAEGRAAGCLTVGVACSGNSIGLSAAELAALPATQRNSLVASAENMLRAAGADLVLESVATLVPALEQYLNQHPTS